MKVLDVRPEQFVKGIRCDRCGVEGAPDAEGGLDKFLQIDFEAGWGSPIGDGTHVEVDLCHACLKETLGQWLRLSPSSWAQRLGPPASKDFMVGADKLPVQERDGLEPNEN